MTEGAALDKGVLWEDYYANLRGAYTSMRRIFKRSGMSQDEIAKKLDVDKGLVSRRLRGLENLTLKTLSFMASAMECRLEIRYIPYADVKRQERTSSFNLRPGEVFEVGKELSVITVLLHTLPSEYCDVDNSYYRSCNKGIRLRLEDVRTEAIPA